VIRKKVVLVLGAGASKPYGYPLGDELRNDLIGISSEVRNVLVEIGHHSDLVEHFRTEFQASNLSSIDAFLARRQNLAQLGRATIAASILQRETSVAAHLAGDWYQYLYNEMMRGVSTDIDEFMGNQLSVITFNYDTSFERFMVNSLRATFDVSLEKAIEVFSKFPVIHVHGKIPYLKCSTAVRPSLFDAKSTQQFQDQIITLHQGQEDSEEFSQARYFLTNAECVVFLGFSYHEDNMARLRVADWIEKSGLSVLGTAYGLEGGELDRAIHSLDTPKMTGVFQNALQNHACYQMLRRHVRIFD